MNNEKNWKRAIDLVNRMLEERVEIYEVMKIFTPMATSSRRALLYCSPTITDQDLDQIELAIDRYNKTLIDLSSTRVDQRIKRSSYFQTLQEHYDKNKNKR